MRRSTFVFVFLLSIALSIAPRHAAANINTNTFDQAARLTATGHFGFVTVLISCEKDQQLLVRARVTQEATQAVAEGQEAGVCTGAEQRIEVLVRIRTGIPLEAGEADACAEAATSHNGQVTDKRQWCAANGIQLRK